MERTAAVILSGGRSRRMGRDQGNLRLGTQTLLERMTAGRAPLFDGVYVSVDRPGRYPGCRELPDLRPGQGPLAGLEAAFRLTGAAEVFLAAVDLPFAPPALAARVARAGTGGDAVVIRRRDGTPEPLFALYRRSCLPQLTACLDGGRRAMKALLDRVDCRWLEEAQLPGFDLDRALFNVNTRAELHQAAVSDGKNKNPSLQ